MLTWPITIPIGRDPVVSLPRSALRLSSLLNCDRHVVRGLHLRRNDHARASLVPRRLGDRPDFQDLPVRPSLSPVFAAGATLAY